MKRAIIIGMVLLASCSGDDGFSEQDRREFVAGCIESGAAEGFCECVGDELQENLTADEAKELEEGDAEDFQTHPRLMAAGEACAEEATP